MTAFAVTPDDRTAWAAHPFKHQTACRDCGEVKMAAGTRRSMMRCLECFARRRHRRIGQLRSKAVAS